MQHSGIFGHHALVPHALGWYQCLVYRGHVDEIGLMLLEHLMVMLPLLLELMVLMLLLDHRLAILALSDLV